MKKSSFSRRVIAAMAGCMLSTGLVFAAGELVPRDGPVPPNSPYVPVNLDLYANDNQSALPGPRQVTVQGIPFDLVTHDGADNLFLRSADWPQWKEDPPDYYEQYDNRPDNRDPRRPFFHIPASDYDCVYLLAATDNAAELSPEMTFRIGAFAYAERVTVHDFEAVVPRAGESKGENVLQVIPAKAGNLFLMRIPLNAPFAQDFHDRKTLDVEVTKKIRLAIHQPDPCRFRYRPLGLPSGVHIYGMTFSQTPVQIKVTSAESGNVFNEPQVPTFQVYLHNVPGLGATPTAPYVVEAIATDYYGKTTTAVSDPVAAIPMAGLHVSVPVKVAVRGWYELRVNLKSGATTLLTRQTNFALLAPNTRHHRDESPWGTWDFGGGHYTPASTDVTAPLYLKAGLHYGFGHGFGSAAEACRKYDLKPEFDPSAIDAAGVDGQVKTYAQPGSISPDRFMIFHEAIISGPHVTRTPDLFTGRPPYKLDEAEKKQFKTLWDGAVAASAAIRKDFPKTTIYFGNGPVQLVEEFMRAHFPRELFDACGNEASSFQRPPEAQPFDIVGNNASLWMDRQLLDHYGYTDVPVCQCYEVCYPCTNPGNLTLRTQAAYLVRHAMHSLAWRVPVIRFFIIVEPGNSYYYSNWGGSGLCFGLPDVSPKPSYVAMAAMTQALDGATFTRQVPCAAPSVYAVEFHRADDNQTVTCLWTVKGRRPMTLELPQDAAADGRVTDIMGNETALAFKDGKAGLEISAEPQYLLTSKPLASLTAGAPALEGKSEGKSFLVSSLGSLKDWSVESGTSMELEMYDPLCPRRKGNFDYRETAEFEGQKDVIEVKPKLPVAGSAYLQMYSVLSHAKGVEIPGEPTEIGLMVNGNGGWGRVIFELEDASGQRWISIGCEDTGKPNAWMADWMTPEQFKALKSSNLADWNTDDAWGRCAISFEGWRYVHIPVPGNYPGERYHWPYNSQWRYSGDGVVKYPLKFKKLVLTMPEKVVHLTDYVTVPRPEICVKDLMVTYEPPEKAFHAE